MKLVGVLIGFIGLFILVGPNSSLDTFSGVLCVIASLSYAVAGIYLAKTPDKMNNSFIGMGSIIVGAIIMFPFIFTGTNSIMSISSVMDIFVLIRRC